MPPTDAKSASEPTLRRLPRYLVFLRELREEGTETVSTTHLAREFGLDPTLVRKDLQSAGVVGRPRVGYELEDLIRRLERFLGWHDTTDAVLAGVGSLGRALIGYKGFETRGIRIVAGFDLDPAKAGTEVGGTPVYLLERIYEIVEEGDIHIGILAVPPDAAQAVTNMMVLAGIQAIWNFSGARLELPPEVLVEDVDLAASLAVLSSKLENRKQSTPTGV